MKISQTITIKEQCQNTILSIDETSGTGTELGSVDLTIEEQKALLKYLQDKFNRSTDV